MVQANSQVRRGGGQQNGNQRAAIAVTADPRYMELRRILEMSKTQIGQIVSKMISTDELIRLCLNAACKTPEMLKCMDDPRGIASIGLALMKAAAMQLRPDGRNGHLIPFWNNTGSYMECQFFPDFKGMVKLMCMSRKVATVNGGAVRENDLFEFEYGSRQFLRHKPAMSDRGQLIAAYAYYTTPSGECCFRVLNADEVKRRQAVAKTDKVWNQWPDEMWAKTALHNLAKIAPLGDDFERAVQIDELDEAGSMTEADLRMMSHNSGTRAIEHSELGQGEPLEFPDDDRELVPASRKPGTGRPDRTDRQEQPDDQERATLQSLQTEIAAATYRTISSVRERVNRELELGDFSQDERDAIAVAMQEKSKEVHARK